MQMTENSQDDLSLIPRQRTGSVSDPRLMPAPRVTRPLAGPHVPPFEDRRSHHAAPAHTAWFDVRTRDLRP